MEREREEEQRIHRRVSCGADGKNPREYGGVSTQAEEEEKHEAVERKGPAERRVGRGNP